MPINGLVVMTPTSIASTGTGNSSSIGANGKVTFSSCVTLSLNGVFTSSYDNYMVTIRMVGAQDFVYPWMRLRVSGTDASGNNYVDQYLDADGTSVAASRTAAQSNFVIAGVGATARTGISMFLFGPNLAQPTAMRRILQDGRAGSAFTGDGAHTHSLSTAYDGFTLLPFGGASITGEVTVYGFNQ